MTWRMDEVLAHRESARAISDALDTWTDQAAAEEIRGLMRPRAVITGVNWGAMPERAAAVADTLETIAFDAGGDAEWRLDTATMIRARAGGIARRGGPFDWTETGDDDWGAIGPTGTDWGVYRAQITVAQWDKPDWVCASTEEAKRVAEEIDARPDYPKELLVNEMPVLAENDDTPPEVGPGERSPNAALEWDPEDLDPEACRRCGSPERARWWKPTSHSTDWWFDPSGYWRCPECHRVRHGPDEPDPRLPVWPPMPGESPRYPNHALTYDLHRPMPRRIEDL